MGWAVGYDPNHRRDIGYGVPAKCDHPDCDADIDRGMAYVCGGDVYGGDDGCGLHFCAEHLRYVYDLEDNMSPQLCECCAVWWHAPDDSPELENPLDLTAQDVPPEPFSPKPDTEEWNRHKMNCPSWEKWREENPEFVVQHKELVDPDYDPDAG